MRQCFFNSYKKKQTKVSGFVQRYASKNGVVARCSPGADAFIYMAVCSRRDDKGRLQPGGKEASQIVSIQQKCAAEELGHQVVCIENSVTSLLSVNSSRSNSVILLSKLIK